MSSKLDNFTVRLMDGIPAESIATVVAMVAETPVSDRHRDSFVKGLMGASAGQCPIEKTPDVFALARLAADYLYRGDSDIVRRLGERGDITAAHVMSGDPAGIEGYLFGIEKNAVAAGAPPLEAIMAENFADAVRCGVGPFITSDGVRLREVSIMSVLANGVAFKALGIAGEGPAEEAPAFEERTLESIDELLASLGIDLGDTDEDEI